MTLEDRIIEDLKRRAFEDMRVSNGLRGRNTFKPVPLSQMAHHHLRLSCAAWNLIYVILKIDPQIK